tara:strand:+ start:722 stop:1903 length:1182 start_codon:yes stop_codon:yes gene_type:complete
MGSKRTKISFANTSIAYAHYSNRKLKKALGVFQLIGNSFLTNIGTTLTKIAIAIHFPIGPFVKPIIFEQFCGGESLKECIPTINLLQQRKVDVSLNYGVEIKNSARDFERTLSKTKGAIEFASRKQSTNVVCSKVSSIGYFDILHKRQEGKELTRKEDQAFLRMKSRMHEICSYAHEHKVAVYWDAEESWVQDEIDILVKEFMAEFNKESAIVFNTYQLYRSDKLSCLKKDIEEAKKEKYILGVKLVRGAYIEKENKWAEDHEIPSVIHESKEAVDKDYNEGMRICLENVDRVSVCIASHNEYSNQLATLIMNELEIPPNHQHVVFSQLYGMGDFISFNLADKGYNSCKYLPYGPVREVIPYLMRRAQENSSVDGQMSRESTMLKKEIKRRGI